MWLFRVSSCTLFYFLIVAPAVAQAPFTVQRLQEICASPEVPRQNVCSAYLAGVRQTMDVFKNSLKQRVGYCIPQKATTGDIRTSFLAWASKNPASTNRAAIAGVMRSIQEAYSCKTEGERFDF